MKVTIKLFLVVVLLNSVVFADDGNMGTSGRTCPNGATTCLAATEAAREDPKSTESTDSILVFVQDYLKSVFGYFEN